MAQTYFSNITLKATPNADLHVLNRAYADLRYMGIATKATASQLGGVTIVTDGGIAVNDGAISIDVARTKTLLELGTAASKDYAAMTGLPADSGKVAVLGADGKLAGAVMPDLAITEVFTATSTDNTPASGTPGEEGYNPGGLLAQSSAKIGDVCIVTVGGVSTVYMLNSSADNAYQSSSNWTKLSVASGVVYSISANGQTAQNGAVSLSFADFWNNAGSTTYKIEDLSTFTNDGHVSVASAQATFAAIKAVKDSRAAKDGTTFGLISVASNAAGLSVTDGVLTTTAATTSVAGVVTLANDYTASGFATNQTDAATPKAVAEYVANQTSAAQQTSTHTSANASAAADSTWVININAALGQYPSVDIIDEDGNLVYADVAYGGTSGAYTVTISFDAVSADDGQFTAILRK